MSTENNQKKPVRVPTIEEAHQIMKRFNASHFKRKDYEHARYTIPADLDRDDDLLMGAFINHAANLQRERDELKGQVVQLTEHCNGASKAFNSLLDSKDQLRTQNELQQSQLAGCVEKLKSIQSRLPFLTDEYKNIGYTLSSLPTTPNLCEENRRLRRTMYLAWMKPTGTLSDAEDSELKVLVAQWKESHLQTLNHDQNKKGG